jgi:hypothetical protein
MKNLRFISFLSVALVFGSLSFYMTSCNPDACKDVTCNNGGTPTESGDDCICDCAAGYEGEFCDDESRVKFVGSWSVNDNCSTSGADSYTVSVTTSSADHMTVLIANFWNAFINPVTATVDGNNVTIATQEPDNDDWTISGSGTINGNTATMTYTITDPGNNQDICNGTWTKQ